MIVGKIHNGDKVIFIKCEYCGKISKLYSKENHAIQAECDCRIKMNAKSRIKEKLIFK